MGKLIEKKSKLAISEHGLETSNPNKRVEVLKTYKIYIGGQFPRTESGRYYVATNKNSVQLANVCLSSRKDIRDAVVSARNAFKGWSARAAFNRGQILYRMAEMLVGDSGAGALSFGDIALTIGITLGKIGAFEKEGIRITGPKTTWGSQATLTEIVSGNSDIALLGPEAPALTLTASPERRLVNFAQLTSGDGSFIVSKIV